VITRHSLRETRDKLHILLAEDNPINQRLAVRLIEKRGHTLVVASNGREALAALGSGSFDVVLMDLQMPEMNGFEATAAIRDQEKQSGKHLPIVAMTANAMVGDRERCLAAGMDGYIAKPIRIGELFEAIENLGATPAADKPSIPHRDAAMDVLDSKAVLDRVEGSKETLVEITNLFLEEKPRLLTAVREAVARQDATALERAAHSLKGSVGIFSAEGAFQAALNLEIMGREGDLAGAQEAYELLNAQIERLQPALEALVMDVVGRRS
jgi:CheY-like chemotaxis protein